MSSTDVIQGEGLFLQCDECSHVEEVPAMRREDIGKPCPVCSANLLTKRDFEDFAKHMKAIDLLNRILGPVEAGAEAAAKISFNTHDGEVKLSIKALSQPSDA